MAEPASLSDPAEIMDGMIIARDIDIEAFFDGDFPPGAELLDGDVIVNEPGFWHQELARRIVRALENWVADDPQRGRPGWGGNWVTRARQTLKPDVWWVSRERAPTFETVRTPIAPDICIEVRSPGTWKYDIGRKRERYQESDCQELWLVDDIARAVYVYRRSSPAAARFDVEDEFGPAAAITTPLLDGFSVAIDELFAR